MREVISQTPINSSQLKAEMDVIKKRDETLGFRAQKTVDYLESMGPLPEKKAEELYKKLEALSVPRLRDVHFHKIIDIMPRSSNEVKTVLQGYNVTVSAESCKKIADVVAEFK